MLGTAKAHAPGVSKYNPKGTSTFVQRVMPHFLRYFGGSRLQVYTMYNSHIRGVYQPITHTQGFWNSPDSWQLTQNCCYTGCSSILRPPNKSHRLLSKGSLLKQVEFNTASSLMTVIHHAAMERLDTSDLPPPIYRQSPNSEGALAYGH